MKKNQLVFIYDYYYPDFTAGGPVTALSNLARLIGEETSLQTITSSYEFKSHLKLEGIESDKWLAKYGMSIWYASNWSGIVKALKSLPSDGSTTLYLNGIFSWRYFILPLFLSFRFKFKVIVSPRGMLQEGALKRRRLKKSVYIVLLKASGLLNKVRWHATDEQEYSDIKSGISPRECITILPDIPVFYNAPSVSLKKEVGNLKLVYFSLITEKKNLLFLLKLLDEPEFSFVQLDIIGPVKDISYWDSCCNFIARMANQNRITYKGLVIPEKVQETMGGYHLLILPTHGENFGHVIIEAMASWRPVLISDKTPWKDVSFFNAGSSIQLEPEEWRKEIRKFLNWDQIEFEKYSLGARDYYQHKFDFEALKKGYVDLFNRAYTSEPESIFIYDYFYPEFSAGGPVTSIHNLSQLIKDKQSVRILVSAYKFKGGGKLENIVTDSWTKWNGVPVWYSTNSRSTRKALTHLPTSSKVTVYLNGIFSLRYFLFPLLVARNNGFRSIISPRGMLQSGAISRHTFKKQFYIFVLKWTGFFRDVTWHATDQQEKHDIAKWIGKSARVVEIPNIPVTSIKSDVVVSKEINKLSLVYFSLISEKKNLLFILELLDRAHPLAIQLHIIGPIKDSAYWELCKKRIKKMRHPERVVYLGPVNPFLSAQMIAPYHALILPTQGENFGHAIIEMLACSRPVIISDKTPWKDLEAYGAGYSIPLEEDEWLVKLHEMVAWDSTDFNTACASARSYYETKFNFDELRMRYEKLFTY